MIISVLTPWHLFKLEDATRPVFLAEYRSLQFLDLFF